MQKKLLLILNPRAGKTQSRSPLFDAVTIFSDAEYLVSVHNTTGRGDAEETAEKEGKNYDAIVCCGGDGTLNETVSGLMRLENPPLLGYLPRGSTNDFASSLHISSNPVTASRVLVKGRQQPLDIGRWNERYFVYVASFGAFTKTSYSAPQAAKNALGHFAYILEGMKDLSSLRPYQVKLVADGEDLSGDYLFGAVCNSTSIGGLMRLDPKHVNLNDGKFELLLIPNPQSAIGLQNLIFAILNQQYDHGGLVFRHVSQIELQTERDLPWSLDGEYAPSAPAVEICNLPGALTFLL